MLNPSHALLAAFLAIVATPAVSQRPAPAPSKAVQEPQSQSRKGEDSAAKRQDVTPPPASAHQPVPTPPAEPQAREDPEHRRDYTSSEWWLVYLTGALVFMTTCLAIYTARLWNATKGLGNDARDTAARQAGETQESLRISRKSADVAEQALVRTERAFVYPQDIRATSYIKQADQPIEWSFEVMWVNSGKSPTRDLRLGVSGHLRQADLPEDNSFRIPDDNVVKALIGPGATVGSDWFHVPGGRLRSVQEGTWFLYVWGCARYRDVFDGTPEHVTKFCYKIGVLGDPMRPAGPDNVVQFTRKFYARHNCTDEDCEEQNEGAT
jgi:hypothetical protein